MLKYIHMQPTAASDFRHRKDLISLERERYRNSLQHSRLRNPKRCNSKRDRERKRVLWARRDRIPLGRHAGSLG